MRRFTAVLLVLCLLLLAGCSAAPEQTAHSGAELPAEGNTTLGYIPSEVSRPEWLGIIWSWDTCGDLVWLAGKDAEGRLFAASYDTLQDQWQQFPLDTGEVKNPSIVNLSVVGDSLWLLFYEGYTDLDLNAGLIPNRLNYYIFYKNLREDNSSCIPIPFAPEAGTESSTGVFFSVQALEEKRALLTTDETIYLIDPEVNVLDQPELSLARTIYHMRVNEQLYIRFRDGFAPYDETSRQFGAPIAMKEIGNFSSNAGHFLSTVGDALYSYDLSSGEKTELFQWLDVALSYSDMGGRQAFENSVGDFYYATSKNLIKITLGPVQEKQTLKLRYFYDSTLYESIEHAYSDELMNAVIRFNNTDPEFRVEIEPTYYSSEADRDRLLIELATSEDVDLVETSFLPENALKEGLLVDMLSYIDADEEISRDDFIQPLLNSMLREGALYEYTDKFTILTTFTRAEWFPGRENWTIDTIQAIAEQFDLTCLSRETMLERFILASTAEFIDWDAMTSSFDSPAFQNWLSFLKEQPQVIEQYDAPILFIPTDDFASYAGGTARHSMGGKPYVISGFPETDGTGSYFVKCSNLISSTFVLGKNTRLGILASGKHQDGAWRFIRTLILGESEATLFMGIPVYKERFEKAIDALAIERIAERQAAVNGVPNMFNEEDAQMLRELVYHTTKLVHTDEALLNIIRSEAILYFEGQISVEEAVQQIQSRVGIYLAEQS